MFLRRHFITALFFLALPAAIQAQFTYVTNSDNVSITITGYTGPGGTVLIPNTISNAPVTGIGDDAFEKCANLASVAIPGGVTNIGDMAFAWCTNLTAAYFGGNAPTNNGTAFYGDTNATVYYLGGTTGWGPAFGGAPTEAETPASQFIYETNNGFITIMQYRGPNGPVVIPGIIGAYPVTSISGLGDLGNLQTSITIPNTVNNIGGSAFEACTFSKVTIPYSVTNIGSQAFQNCSSLTTVTVLGRITVVAFELFADCKSLTNVSLPDSVTIFDGATFIGCSALTTVNIPNSVTTIGVGTFDVCSSLTSVTIPNSVTFIGEEAFYDCTSLTSAYFGGNAPPDDGTAFAGSPTTVYYLPGTAGWTNTFGGAPTALWYQPQPTVLSFEPSFGVQNEQFGFTISWATNASVIVQACTNLANPNWIPVATNALNSGTNYFSDPQWMNYPNRFYRVSGP